MRTISVTTVNGSVLLDGKTGVTVQGRAVALQGNGEFEFYVTGVHADVGVEDARNGGTIINASRSTDCIVTLSATAPDPPWRASTNDAILTLAPFDPLPVPGYAMPGAHVAAAALAVVLAVGALQVTAKRSASLF